MSHGRTRDRAQSRDDDDAQVPEGWAEATIGEVTQIHYGKGLRESDRIGDSVPVFGSNGMVGAHSTALAKGPTIIIGRKGSIGAVHFSPRPCWPIDTTYFIDSFNGIDPTYLAHVLRSLNLPELDTSTAIPGLNREDLRRQSIPVPPLAEQKRLVARIEELLARVNSAREHLDRVPAILKRFRQAVLVAAYSGRLTADWRETHSPTESGVSLLERIEALPNRAERRRIFAKETPGGFARAEIRDGEALPTSWAWASVGIVTTNHDGRRVPVKADDRAKRHGPYPYYGASGIIDNIDDYLFDGDYLLIAEDGANLVNRNTPIAFRACGKFWVNNHAHVVQTRGSIPLSFLESYLNSIDLQEYITGSAQPKLTQDALNRIPVPVPPLEEQSEVAQRIQALFKLADSVEKRLAAATARAESLTKGILAKAFRGELVPTEDELARLEGRDYEPASVLLERIRGERPAAAPRLKTRVRHFKQTKLASS